MNHHAPAPNEGSLDACYGLNPGGAILGPRHQIKSGIWQRSIAA